jgi:hypothetical protein
MIRLLKHEFVRTWPMLGLAGGVAVLVALAGALLGATGWPVLATFGTVLTVMAAFALVPVVQILLAVQYWQSSYGRTGYLTQTLPLKGATIYWAKMLWAWLVSIVGTAVSVGIGLGASRLTALGDAGPLVVEVSLREAWNQLQEVAPGWGTVALVAAFLMMILIWPTQYFFAASIGSQAPMNRLGAGGPVLVWLGLYVVVQVLTFVSFAAVPLAVGMQDGTLAFVRFDVFAEMAAGTSPQVMPVGFVPALLLVAGACLVWTVHSWKRRVSLV